MKTNAVPLLAIFDKKMRLDVPLFQRQYVWTRELQWEPLWDDIELKLTEHLEQRPHAPVHFLGALVLDQKATPTTHVERRLVIDGQQRLTTLQIFLAAFRDLAKERGAAEIAAECMTFTTNSGMMADREADPFKVWPTKADRAQFIDVMTAGSREALERRHPVVRRPRARSAEARPPMVEAYLFFHDVLGQFIDATSETARENDAEVDVAKKLEQCFNALRGGFQFVVIDLDQDDDAQVIFETLNARGQPLLPADLLRNYIFLRAGRAAETQEDLYEQYWQRFDDAYWRTEVRQGRLARPRSDLFMQHFLASRQGTDIPVRHLFAEYRTWIERTRPFSTVRAELETLARQRDDFRRILDPGGDDVLHGIGTALATFEVRTAYPLLLYLLDQQVPDAEWSEITDILESYVVRRAVCGWTTKNYNRVFLGLTQKLAKSAGDGPTTERLRRMLAEMRGESTEWPNDNAFAQGWERADLYQSLGSAKLVHILSRLNDTYYAGGTERGLWATPLTVEHIMPQKWREAWPLRDGSSGLPEEDVWTSSSSSDSRLESTRCRDQLVGAIGNLTLLTQAMNSAQSNKPWAQKRGELARHSVLPINLPLVQELDWDEGSIAERSQELFRRACTVWSRETLTGAFSRTTVGAPEAR